MDPKQYAAKQEQEFQKWLK